MGTKLGTTGIEANREDMANPPGMELHGSSWRVKKRVPLDLLRDYPQYYPKPFLRLNTEESDKKRAATKAWAWLGTIEEMFQRVRDTGSPYKRQVPDDVAQEIIQKAVHSVLAADEETRAQGYDPDHLRPFRSAHEEYLAQERDAIANGRLTEGQLQTANEWLFAHGFELAEDSPELRQFALKFFRAMSRPRQIQRQRDAGDWVDTPPLPVRMPAPEVPNLSKVIEYFIGNQKSDVPMFKKYRPALGLFLEFVGDKPVDKLKQKEIDDYFAFLCKLPPRWDDEKRKRKVSAVELAKMEWPKCISKKTFDDGYMAAFRPFLIDSVRVFQDQGFPGTLTTSRIKYSGTRDKTENSQRAMRQDELVRLFTGPEYQSFAVDTSQKHCYWLPLIGLYTGARVNEVCQLNPQCDIREENGVWLFDFTEDSESDARVKKTLKNASSHRKVPIHSELIRLGFLAHVETLRGQGSQLLFPEWPPYSGRAAGKAEKWFRQLIQDTKLRDETPGARLVGFHVFRHTLLNNAMNNDVQFAEWITGHASEGVSRVVSRYRGEAEITKKAKIVEAIQFDVRPPVPTW